MNRQSTQSTDARTQHTKRALLSIAVAGLFLSSGFTVFHYTTGDMAAMWINIAMALLSVGALLAVHLDVGETAVYRYICAGIAAGMLSFMFVGPHPPYFQFVTPLLIFFFLGPREGMIWSTGYLFSLTVMLYAPELIGSHAYSAHEAARLLSCYLIVMIIGWHQATSHEQFSSALISKNEQLQRALSQGAQTGQQLKQTADKLQDQSQLLETILDNMGEGIVVGDASGRLVFFNASAERIIGKGFTTDTPPDQWSETYGVFDPDGERLVPTDELPLVRALRGESTDGFEALVRNEKRPDGALVRASARPLRNPETGKITSGMVVFQDITRQEKTAVQLQQTSTELREQSQLMETMFNSVSDGLVVTDKDGNFLFVNPTAESIVGMGATDLPPDQWSETYGTFYPDGETPFPSDQLPLARAMRGETLDDVELLIRNPERPKGVNISVNARPLRDAAGVLEGGLIVLRDVTKIKKAEYKLRQNVRRLQEQTQLMETVFESMDEGIIVSDLKGHQVFHNPSADRITGKRTERVNPHEWARTYGLFHLDKKTWLPVQENPLAKALRGKATDDIELFVRNENKPNGVYISVTGRPIRDQESGEVKAAAVVFRDITNFKKTAARLEQTISELRSQTETMETIFNSISDGVIVADENGTFTIFNPSAERLVGIGSTDTGPDEWTDQYGIFFPDRETPVPTEEIPLVRTLRGEAVDEAELFIRNPKMPEGVYLSVSGRPLRGDGGELKGGVVVFRDVTQRTLAEEALTQAFSQGRLEIVDTILHNIGNAINSVSIGVGTVHEQLTRNVPARRLSSLAKALQAHRGDWISYLQSDPQGQKAMPFILALADDFDKHNAQLKQTIERVGDRVAHIVDIIRTQRSFESETMARKQIDFRKAVTDAVKLLQESIAKRGVLIQIDCDHAPKEIRIQESKFNQMLVNLIKNGIEAIDDLTNTSGLQEQPCIRIRAYVQKHFLVLDVTDNGIGIETKVSKLIFSAGYTTKKTGSGLGLHSAANFVIGSGGKIESLSDGLGKGATMRVRLRLSSVAPQHESGAPAPRGEEAGLQPETVH